MTHQRPIPEAAQSPYPLHPAPMPERSGTETEMKGASEANAGDGEESAGLSSWASENRVGLGAALGIGSAAIVAALLYTRYGRRDERNRRGATARKGRSSSKAA